MNVRVKGDNEDAIRVALANCDGISEFRELPLVADLNAKDQAAELVALEEKHTQLTEVYGKMQQRAAVLLVDNKNLRQALGKLDDLTTVLIRCIAATPVEPAEQNVALNIMAATLSKTQGQLGQLQGLMKLAQEAQAKVKSKQGRPTEAPPS